MLVFSPREKKLLIALCILVGAVVLFYIVIDPYLNFRKSTVGSGAEAQSRVNELESVYSQYRNIKEKKEKYERLMKQSSGASILVEEYAARFGIQNNKVYNRESDANIQNKLKKTTTQVKFEGINIKAALDFIYSMENSDKLIKISSLRINQGIKERNNYDITIVFESYTNGQL